MINRKAKAVPAQADEATSRKRKKSIDGYYFRYGFFEEDRKKARETRAGLKFLGLEDSAGIEDDYNHDIATILLIYRSSITSRLLIDHCHDETDGRDDIEKYTRTIDGMHDLAKACLYYFAVKDEFGFKVLTRDKLIDEVLDNEDRASRFIPRLKEIILLIGKYEALISDVVKKDVLELSGVDTFPTSEAENSVFPAMFWQFSNESLSFFRRICDIISKIVYTNKEERPTAQRDLKDEDKLNKASLAPIFEGQLDRETMAQALAAVMKSQSLSNRSAATAARVGRQLIERINSGDASLDKAATVLERLGYELHVEVRKADHS